MTVITGANLMLSVSSMSNGESTGIKKVFHIIVKKTKENKLPIIS